VEPMSDLAKLVIKRFPENRNLQLMGLRIPARFHCSRCSTTQRAKLLGGSVASVTPPREAPSWPQIHEQLRRKGVTLHLLWQEYRHAQPDGFRYSRFCELYREWAEKLAPLMRLPHEPGEKVFVDWAGMTVPIHQSDGTTTHNESN